jgi:hypothetical protein
LTPESKRDLVRKILFEKIKTYVSRELDKLRAREPIPQKGIWQTMSGLFDRGSREEQDPPELKNLARLIVAVVDPQTASAKQIAARLFTDAHCKSELEVRLCQEIEIGIDAAKRHGLSISLVREFLSAERLLSPGFAFAIKQARIAEDSVTEDRGMSSQSPLSKLNRLIEEALGYPDPCINKRMSLNEIASSLASDGIARSLLGISRADLLRCAQQVERLACEQPDTIFYTDEENSEICLYEAFSRMRAQYNLLLAWGDNEQAAEVLKSIRSQFLTASGGSFFSDEILALMRKIIT